jgi:hypothetical protein
MSWSVYHWLACAEKGWAYKPEEHFSDKHSSLITSFYIDEILSQSHPQNCTRLLEGLVALATLGTITQTVACTIKIFDTHK